MCPICFNECKLSETFALSCNERLCKDCFIEAAKTSVDSGIDCVSFACPAGCDLVLTPHNWKDLVTKENY